MKSLRIAHIYPDLLNLYGDGGNVLCLKKRLLWRNIDCKIDEIMVGMKFNPDDYDIVFIGGGQDFEQNILLDDLGKGNDYALKKAVQNGAVILAICGGFQLLGNYYETSLGKRLNFIGAVDFYTVGKGKRLIGNYLFKTEEKIKVVGFENHSGRTYLGNGVKPFGKIIKGYGNNGKDKTEGIRYKNTFGTYCHGPLLPKNPVVADSLIRIALKRKYGESEILDLNDEIENFAREQTFSLYY